MRTHDATRWLFPLLLAATFAAPVSAASWRIAQVFSNQDGSTQFVRITRGPGADADDPAEAALTVTQGDRVRRYALPRAAFAALSSGDVVIGASPEIPGRGLSVPIFEYSGCCIAAARLDVVLPPRFLFVDGATIDLAGVDRFTYEALPTDGANALYRDGSVQPAALPTTACPGAPPFCPREVHPTPTLVTAIEYYNIAQDHFFTTAWAPDIDALDTERIPGWARTGESFAVGVRPVTRLGLEYEYRGAPACRYYIPPAFGDSHFISVLAPECAAVRVQLPQLVLETEAAFYAALPIDDPDFACGTMPGTVDGDVRLVPVYRLWNGRADSNHRYTTREAVRQSMVELGWRLEGIGEWGAALCVPPAYLR